MLEESKKRSAQYESQATMALRQGNRDLARQFVREKASNDSTIVTLEASYQQALQTVESVKIAIKRQEEEVRKKTAEALTMKAQWKQAQIQNSIAKALEGLTFENQFESFGAAAERIKDAQSEASARQEMMGESIQGKIMAMEDKAMDYEAEEQLQKLEEKLGMRAAPAPTTEEAATQSVSVTGEAPAVPKAPEPPASEVDRELEELEKRLQGDGTKN
jgi:phage shock protein A